MREACARRGQRGSSIRERGIWALVLFGLFAPRAAGAGDLWGAAAAPRAVDAGARWIALGDQRAGEGRFAAAAAAYLAAIAAAPTPAMVSTRLGDVLMAQGELASAQLAYRQAIATAAVGGGPSDRDAVHLDDVRGRGLQTALACAGLAAALDRAGQGAAARQMVREALAADPTASVLEVATLPDADVRVLPDGEVFYRLGLVRQVTGRRADAVAAFRTYLERAPSSRWADAAQAHLAELESPAGRRPARPGNAAAPRLLAAATVLATGGSPAPLIDAAWRGQAAILDACLADAGALLGTGSAARIAIELEIDGRGRVVTAAAKLPAAGTEPLARCLEEAVRRGLRLPAPPGGRGTRARTELLIGVGGP